MDSFVEANGESVDGLSPRELKQLIQYRRPITLVFNRYPTAAESKKALQVPFHAVLALLF